MTISKWLQSHTHSLRGKRVAISGATGGIGQELCRYLCLLEAELILLDRNREKSITLQNSLKSEFPHVKIEGMTLDLECMDTVRQVAMTLAERPLFALILNAGAYHIPRHPCSTGVDNIFQINFLAPYALVKMLLPHLKSQGGRVVAVGSIAHNYSVTDPSDIDFVTRSKHSKAYGNAKRFLMFSLFELFEGDRGLAVTHPGITFTNITAHYPKVIFALIKHPMKVIFMKPRRACLSILQGLFEDCQSYQWIGPRYFRIWGLPIKKTLKTCTPEESRWIFDTAESLYQQLSAER